MISLLGLYLFQSVHPPHTTPPPPLLPSETNTFPQSVLNCITVSSRLSPIVSEQPPPPPFLRPIYHIKPNLVILGIFLLSGSSYVQAVCGYVIILCPPTNCEKSVSQYSGATYKGFRTVAEARAYLRDYGIERPQTYTVKKMLMN